MVTAQNQTPKKKQTRLSFFCVEIFREDPGEEGTRGVEKGKIISIFKPVSFSFFIYIFPFHAACTRVAQSTITHAILTYFLKNPNCLQRCLVARLSYTHGFLDLWKILLEIEKRRKKKNWIRLRGGDMSVAPSYDPNLLQVTFEKPNGPIG